MFSCSIQQNKPFAIYLLESLSDIFKYFYALSELTQIFSLVQQSEPHKTRSSFHVCFKLLNPKTCFANFS